MKKVFLAFILVLIFGRFRSFQTTADKIKESTTTKTATTKAGPVKKGGRPDMRYRANENAA